MIPKVLALAAMAGILIAQPQSSPSGPDPKEIPLPPIATAGPAMPVVDKLPNRPDLPDVLTMNNGKKVTTVEQWKRRREEMKQILEYYAVGHAPPPPRNVKGK